MQTVTGTPSTSSTCRRCLGAGKLEVYRHVENGLCFRCEGSGKEAASQPIASTPSFEPAEDYELEARRHLGRAHWGE